MKYAIGDRVLVKVIKDFSPIEYVVDSVWPKTNEYVVTQFLGHHFNVVAVTVKESEIVRKL